MSQSKRMTGKTAFEEIDVRTVVFVGRKDFGRCPLTARLPAALWPIAGKPAVGRLLHHLANEGITSAAICCGSDVSALVGPIHGDTQMTVRLVVDELSSGTAGALRDAASSDPGDLILVFSGSVACPPSIDYLIEGHRASEADITIAFNPAASDWSSWGGPAEIYVCRPDILKFIPSAGYFDIKEGLIPAVLRAGGTIKPLVLTQEAGNFHDRVAYLDAVSMCLRKDSEAAKDYGLYESCDKQLIPTTTNGHIHPETRIYGPVAIAEDARIAENAVIVGPAVIDAGTVVGESAVIVKSVLWEEAKVGAHSEIHEALIDRRAAVPDGASVAERIVSPGTKIPTRRSVTGRGRPPGKRIGDLGHVVESCLSAVAGKLPICASLSARQLGYALGGAVILLAFLWSYWPTLRDLWKVWLTSDEYSAGLLIPVLTVYVLWVHRWRLATVPVRPSVCWGVVAFVLAQSARGVGLYLLYGSAEMLSVVLSVAALILLLFGWRLLLKLAPILLFLFLMLPWPHRIQTQVSLPLQRWATDSAVFCLELIGYEVVQDGNVIGIGDTSVAVAEACNGLRMITAFLVISGLVVLLVNRAWWEKLIVLVSSLPVAFLCNTLRLTITAIFFTILEGENVEKMFHDFGGYAMMPLALGMVLAELWLLRRLTTPQTQVEPAVITRRKPRQAVES